MAKKLPAGWTTGQGGWAAKPTLGAGWQVAKGADGKFYARKQSGGAAAGGGGTTPAADTPIGLPDGWGMDKGPDIVGSWKSKPNLNTDQYEVQQGTDKKWYGRKITELTGLDPWMKAAVSKWDTDQANRNNLIGGIESQAVNASKTIADAGAARMKDLAALVNAPAQQSQALGAVAGGPQQMASGDQQAGGIAAGSAAKLAISQMADNANTVAASAPTIAANSIATLANKERSDSAANRQKLITAFQTTVANAKAAENKALAQTYTDQARLLAAAIQSGAKITAEQLNQMGQNARTTQTNETSLANNAADNQTSSQNNANTTNSKNAENRRKATSTFVTNVPQLIMGKKSQTKGADGKITTTITQEGISPMQVLTQGLAQGIPAGPILGAILAQNTPAINKLWRPSAGKTNRPKAMEVGSLLLSKGIAPANVRKVVLRYMGIDLGPSATGKGAGGVDLIP